MINRFKVNFHGLSQPIILGVGLVTVLLLSGSNPIQAPKWVAPPEADNYQNPLSENTKATDKGGRIYQKLCWTCHGKTGKGDGPAAAALTIAPADYSGEIVQSQSDGAIYWKITHGRGEMVSYKATLTDEQRWMLVNYIRQLGSSDTVN